MLERLERHFFGFFELIDFCWNYLSTDILKSLEFKYKQSILNRMKNTEEKFKMFNPISIFIGTLIMFTIVFYFLKFLKRTWKKISIIN